MGEQTTVWVRLSGPHADVALGRLPNALRSKGSPDGSEWWIELPAPDVSLESLRTLMDKTDHHLRAQGLRAAVETMSSTEPRWIDG